MARKRTGTLIRNKSGWGARAFVAVGVVDGEIVRERRYFNLETDNKAIAKAKLEKLLREAEHGLPEPAATTETFEQAATRVVKRQGRQGMKTWRERLSRLRRLAFPELGSLPCKMIKPHQIRDVLDMVHEATQSRQSVVHLRDDLMTVFRDLHVDQLIASNPVKDFKLNRKKLRQDARRRQMPTDREFGRVMACDRVAQHVKVFALSSRTLGGMRTSDLHAWDWRHIDTQAWRTAFVYRPKTQGDDESAAELVEHEIPSVLQVPLKAWWERQGRPTSGPVFPIMAGPRAGERQGKRSHVREFRAALWVADVHRPLPGFDEAMEELRRAEAAVEPAKDEGRQAWWAAQRARREAEQRAKALDALQTDTAKTRAADIHGLRREYATALAAAGTNVYEAMALAGHSDPRTHARYVKLTGRGALKTPKAALPKLDGQARSRCTARAGPIVSSSVFWNRIRMPSITDPAFFSVTPAGLEPALPA
ncbi:MAG: tyrosine-type recombinase/integrase [Myxococcales bacterium]|nr:tyrosine-type recombinase/integrase [Myxococcales bacterium]MCB9580976.1 tyrosine-type recombinase/integrase [Polyangiaceae bacterium]